MRIVIFCHSIVSDWNHGNAHFLRGIATELIARGHQVRIYEPGDGWSLHNLISESGEEPVREFHVRYPALRSIPYDLQRLDLDEVLDSADLVLVHEWNAHSLVRRIGEHRRLRRSYRLLFHDTHHRSVTDRASMASYDLSNYDGVLAFGAVIRDLYLHEGWAERAWIWHEAADVRVFHPMNTHRTPEGDLVWIGNWGDGERSAELHEFLLEPVKALGLRARVHGVRYPESARAALASARIEYTGWIANYQVPEVFAGFKMTVHVPRRPYAEALPGIPTIRVFEALACGIPLICAPWEDSENLFSPGEDYLVARDGREMQQLMRFLIKDEQAANEMAMHGLNTIRARHTCGHRVDELLAIYRSLEARSPKHALTEEHTHA
jgi:spore maturation protein CgeB